MQLYSIPNSRGVVGIYAGGSYRWDFGTRVGDGSGFSGNV